MRVTKKFVQETIDTFNSLIREFGHDCTFKFSSRNNYHALDLGYDNSHKIVRNIVCGTPLECIQAATLYFSDICIEYGKSQLQKQNMA